MAAITRPSTQSGRGEVIDFSGVNIFTLTAAVLLIFAFIFMPWSGIELADNGARYMSDTLYGSVGAQSSLLILLVPLAGLLAAGLALWGMMSPDRGRVASRLCIAPGVLGLLYYAAIFLNAVPSPIYERGAGLGFWVALFCSIGFILQVAGGVPRVQAGTQQVTGSVGRALPHIPRQWVPYLFLLAPLLLYLVWIILPTLYTFYLSMTRWEGFGQPVWIGFENFERLTGIGTGRPDRDFVQALINNARWLVVFITVPTTTGLGMAMVFNTEMRGGRWYKVSFYAPLVLSYPVIALVWLWLYNPRLGLINSLLTGLGVADPPSWIADSSLAIWCIIIAAVW
ncbi:MAG: sugar ABC transporter permease, partial [Anaerolineae bacterium]|nr:sugar ABC transporter permease [Anaerolineae bacterium]